MHAKAKLNNQFILDLKSQFFFLQMLILKFYFWHDFI